MVGPLITGNVEFVLAVGGASSGEGPPTKSAITPAQQTVTTPF